MNFTFASIALYAYLMIAIFPMSLLADNLETVEIIANAAGGEEECLMPGDRVDIVRTIEDTKGKRQIEIVADNAKVVSYDRKPCGCSAQKTRLTLSEVPASKIAILKSTEYQRLSLAKRVTGENKHQQQDSRPHE